MHLTARQRYAGEIEFGILYGAIAMMSLAAARFLPVLDLVPSCAFQAFTGFPCPACGTTRSLVHLAHGDLRHALAMNPVFAVAMIGALLFLLYNSGVLFSSSRLSLAFTPREASLIRAGAVVVLLANWAYLILNR